MNATAAPAQMAPTPLLYDVPEACRMLDCGRSTLYELMAAGELESVRLGRRRLIPHAAIVALVDRLPRA